jgi:hypothetical protein
MSTTTTLADLVLSDASTLRLQSLKHVIVDGNAGSVTYRCGCRCWHTASEAALLDCQCCALDGEACAVLDRATGTGSDSDCQWSYVRAYA